MGTVVTIRWRGSAAGARERAGGAARATIGVLKMAWGGTGATVRPARPVRTRLLGVGCRALPALITIGSAPMDRGSRSIGRAEVNVSCDAASTAPAIDWFA